MLRSIGPLRLLAAAMLLDACCAVPTGAVTRPDAALGEGGLADAGLRLDGALDLDAHLDAGPAGAPFFVEVGAAAGLTQTHGAVAMSPGCRFDDLLVDGPGDHCDAEWAIAGAAVADFDGDGDPDVFLTRLDGPPSLYVNQGDGTFRDEAESYGVRASVATSGAAFGDVDRDGDLDLFVTTLGGSAHLLYLRQGARFVERAMERGVALAGPLPLLGTSASFGDYDGDGDLDLYVGEWRSRRQVHDGASMARLLRNRGPAMPGYFEDVTLAAGVSMEDAFEGVAQRGVYVYGTSMVDADLDGRVDLALAGDFRTARLFYGAPGGGFTDETTSAGVGTETNAMGSTFGDFDGDGDLDWLVTSIWMFPGLDSGNRLYRNEGARRYTDVTEEAGLRDGGWGWGVAFFDYDNDGDLDATCTNGFFLPNWLADPMRLWRNDGALPFVEVAQREGMRDTGQGRALVLLDYDLDGDQDVLVARYGDTPLLFRNERGSESSWLRVRAIGTASAIDGRGARVYVQRTASAPEQLAVIDGVTSYLGHSELVAHFGLGEHDAALHSVRVVFPSGSVVMMNDVMPRRTLVVTEP